MQDPRLIFDLISQAREKFPENGALIEVISEKLNSVFKPITPKQRLALRRFPVQYVNKIPQEDGEWTSQLHIWAELGVLDILDLDPIFLSFKNSYGDTVLMSFFRGATGSLTDKMDYNLIKLALSKDYRFLEPIPREDGSVEFEENDPIEDLDYFNQTPLDYLIDIAYADGDYAGEMPDTQLQSILDGYLEMVDNLPELQPDESMIVADANQETLEELPPSNNEVVDVEKVKEKITSV